MFQLDVSLTKRIIISSHDGSKSSDGRQKLLGHLSGKTQQMGNDEGISPSPDDPKDPKCLNRMCGPNRGESFNLEDRQKHFVGYDNH